MTFAAAKDAPRWDLGKLYQGKDDPALERDLARVMEQAEVLRGKYRGRISQLTPHELQGLLQAYEALSQQMSRLGAFASLSFAENAHDDAGKALYARMRTGLTEVHTELQFIDLEIQHMEYDRFTRVSEAPELAAYRYHLERVRRYAPHTLTDGEERLFALKNTTGVQAWTQLYVEVTSRLSVEVGTPAKPHHVTVDEARALRQEPDRQVRQRATEGIFRAHEAQAHVLTYIFNTVFEDHRQNLTLRHYDDAMAPTLLEEDLAAPVVESLMSATEAHYGLAQRYYRTKARVLGIDDFATHDVLAPYSSTSEHLPYAEAQRMVVEALESFSPQFAQLTRGFFSGYVDVPPAPGKQGGAFCSGMSPGLHPYILLNYTHTLQDALTLAHEIGHGIHFLLAGEAQNLLNYYPITPLAETASTFAEIITVNRLLARERNPLVRRQLLATRIEDAISTIMRQVMYTRWEQKAHLARQGGIVSAEDYSALWVELNRDIYGDAVRTADYDRWGWITIPHLVKYRFYCYSYAFGQLLVYALYQQYQEEGASFVPKLTHLLAAGGSAPASDLLRRIDIDISDPGFWRKGFVLVESMLGEFEEAVAETT